MRGRPPRLAEWLLKVICSREIYDDIQGDLREIFANRRISMGPLKAKFHYWKDVILSTRNIRLRRKYRQKHSNSVMFRHYLMVSARTLKKNWMATVIKVLGLAISISICLVIFKIVSFELSFNRSLPGYEKIYRMYTRFESFSTKFSGVPTAIPLFVKNNLSGIEVVSHFQTWGAKLKVPGETAPSGNFDYQPKIIITDPEYFDIVHQYKWLAGSPHAALSEPLKVVLTESKARLYFGTTNPDQIVDQTLIYEDSLLVTVAGIISDPPSTSDFDFTDFISYSTINNTWLKQFFEPEVWDGFSSSSQLFVKLHGSSSFKIVESQMDLIRQELIRNVGGNPLNWSFALQPLSDLHFNQELRIFDNSRNAAHRPTLNILIIIGFFLLAIAIVNFVNLETATSLNRAKEVGIRKILGSSRQKLISRFLSESFIVTLISVLISLPLAVFAMDVYADFIPDGVTMGFNDLDLWIFLGILIMFIGLISGIYPAIVISSFLPSHALKGRVLLPFNGSTSFLRKGLIVFQFTISQILVVGSILIGSQIYYLLNKDLGFTKDGIIYIRTPSKIIANDNTEALKNELMKIPMVKQVGKFDSNPAQRGSLSSKLSYIDDNNSEINARFEIKSGDETYFDFYDMTLLAGRTVKPDETFNELVINKQGIKALGFQSPESALGREVKYEGEKPWTIVGVVNDFHFKSLRAEIQPLAYKYREGRRNFMMLKLGMENIRGEELEEVIGRITATWSSLYPDNPIDISFFDETIEGFYKNERRTAKLTTTATAIAILISCLGLYGLAFHIIAQRSKELGVRKVLGATFSSLIQILSFDFIKLIFTAALIGLPISYFLGNIWLQNYAYHTSTSWWIFVLTVIISIIIASLSIYYHVAKAASSNPVEILRDE